MISILNHISLLRLLVVFDWWKHINMDDTLPFWVIMRSGRRNVMNHIASRGAYLIVLSSGCGEFFYHESYCDESVIMTIYGFLNIQIFCDVSSGVGLCPYMAYGRVYPYMGLSIPPQVFRGTKKPHSLLLIVIKKIQVTSGAMSCDNGLSIREWPFNF